MFGRKLEKKNQELPPKGLTTEELREWWLRNSDTGNRIKVTDDYERVCPKCGDRQACTGHLLCTSCGASLRNATRTKNTRLFDPNHH